MKDNNKKGSAKIKVVSSRLIDKKALHRSLNDPERVNATIIWDGFRKDKPISEGTHYGPQIQFSGEDVFSDDTVWSSDIIVGKTEDEGNCKILIKYLAEGAPKENLKSGNKFKLFEGPRYVAKGVIL